MANGFVGTEAEWEASLHATPIPITDRLTSLLGTDDIIVMRGSTPNLASMAVVAAYLGTTPADTAPAAFMAGDWTAAATATAGEISFNLTTLPADGGDAITALEYRVGTGSAIAFAGTGTGVRVVTAGLTAGAAADLQVRAVNTVGAGAWSDIKNRTPLASAGTTYVRFATLDSTTETGDGTTGWIYTTGNGGNGRAADYTLAAGVAGGMAVQMDANGAWPVAQFRTADVGNWDIDYHLMVYADGTDWYCATAGLTSVVTVPRTYAAGDWARISFDATNGFVVEIARAATPSTWLELAAGTLTRGATLYPRVNGIFGAGAAFTAPRVAP